MFEKTNEIWLPMGKHNDFSREDMELIANSFVPGIDFNTQAITEAEIEERKDNSADYSLLVATNASQENAELLNELFKCWKNGTKVFFFCSLESECNRLKELACSYLEECSLTDELIFEDGTIFNLTIEYVTN